MQRTTWPMHHSYLKYPAIVTNQGSWEYIEGANPAVDGKRDLPEMEEACHV